ncbi:Myosin light chain kinase, smooth muscle [Anabarilius grahami]|uniref:Myosin light chain kinase, smooth muscle n=1 Tax=Anabarilius grahami TaxID=495550 RepID=A0A3N0YD63_ANAGA|nr:Myosin light chain kinase, smooth muscle [Anabarilius grahami]
MSSALNDTGVSNSRSRYAFIHKALLMQKQEVLNAHRLLQFPLTSSKPINCDIYQSGSGRLRRAAERRRLRGKMGFVCLQFGAEYEHTPSSRRERTWSNNFGSQETVDGRRKALVFRPSRLLNRLCEQVEEGPSQKWLFANEPGASLKGNPSHSPGAATSCVRRSDSTLNRASSSTPQHTPNRTSSSTPKHTPNRTSSSTPKHTPNRTSSSTPQHTPNRTSSSTPKHTMNHTSSSTPKYTPNLISSSTPKHTPNHISSSTPKHNPNHISSSTPKLTPNHTSSSTPKLTPNHTSSSTPKHTPNRTSSSTPSHTPITADLSILKTPLKAN